LFGIFLTPVFYFVIQWASDKRVERRAAREIADESPDSESGGEPTRQMEFAANGDAQRDGLTGNGVVQVPSQVTH
jgi:hypothetical protein